MNDIRRERTKKMYVDIVCDMVRNQGMEAVTIRSISEKAGYNSATLYSYFENLPELLLCAQLQFEEEICRLFQDEIKNMGNVRYYDVWPHMYALFYGYYLDNPNIFDFGFVADFAGDKKNIIREQRGNQSALQRYVGESLFRIAEETGKPMEVMWKINSICMSQLVGTVLLFTKGRFDEKLKMDVACFEEVMKHLIENFMEVL